MARPSSMKIPTAALCVALVACSSAEEPGASEEPVTHTEGGEDPTEPAPEETDPDLVVGEDACERDEDCVPAGCCHAAACVAQANAPDCGEVICTMDCRYGTLDCGGACLCHEGRCAARLSRPPAGLVR